MQNQKMTREDKRTTYISTKKTPPTLKISKQRWYNQERHKKEIKETISTPQII